MNTFVIGAKCFEHFFSHQLYQVGASSFCEVSQVKLLFKKVFIEKPLATAVKGRVI